MRLSDHERALLLRLLSRFEHQAVDMEGEMDAEDRELLENVRKLVAPHSKGKG